MICQYVWNNVVEWAGPDYAYACRWASRSVDVYNGNYMLETSALRGVAWMYGEPFILPYDLWFKERYQARLKSSRALQQLVKLQRNNPWVKPNIPTYLNGLPRDLSAFFDHKHGGGSKKTDVVQASANHFEASYWMWRLWHDELLAMYPQAWTEYRTGMAPSHLRVTDIQRRDQIQTTRKYAMSRFGDVA